MSAVQVSLWKECKEKLHFVQICAHVATVQIDPANLKQMFFPTIRLQMMNAINNDAINNDKLDISDYNQNDDLLELMSLVGGEEDDEDITEDVIDFLLN